MKVLINDSNGDTTPNGVIVYGKHDTIILITKEDIEKDDYKSELRGFTFNSILIPKEYESSETLFKTKIWKAISPILNQKYTKIIHY